MIITIDGPAGTGKSTVAKKVASILGFSLLDTGALYRAIAYALMVNGIDMQDENSIEQFLKRSTVDVSVEPRYIVGGLDTTPHIRTPEVSDGASRISQYKVVRTFLLPLQRRLASQQNTVCEGRDMGTVVFPTAPMKIFLTARPEVRAQRRFLELQDKNPTMTHEAVQKDLEERDHRDSTRSLSPLKIPPDAIVIDTSDMSIDQVVSSIVEPAKRRMPHWELFSHQADIGIRGIGPTLSTAFEQVATALTAVITDPSLVRPTTMITFSCHNADIEPLLFDFLNELIYEMDTRHMLFSRFAVELSLPNLTATAWGEPVVPKTHQPAVEVKAATYHALSVFQTDDHWVAQTVVDV